MNTMMRTVFPAAIFLLVVASGCHGALRNLPVEGGITNDRSRVEPKLTRVASAVIGARVEVRCWSQRDWLELIEDKETGAPHEYAGIASEGGPVDLAPEACRPLVPVLYTKWRPHRLDHEAEVAYAVGILAHELEHVRGEMDEKTAECHGLQRLAGVARRLGFSSRDSQSLARVYWIEIYPGNFRTYRAPGCRDGAELDLRPRSSAWP